MLEDEVDLHRLIWSPDDFDGDQLLPSAFRRDDLKGGEGYISVSRTDQLQPEAELNMAKQQAGRANGKNFVREDAWSILFNCGRLRAARDDEGLSLFAVTPEPIPDVNPAHCGIRNISGKTGRGYINQLRIILVKLAASPRRLDCFLQNWSSTHKWNSEGS